jgi:hypothetical protein
MTSACFIEALATSQWWLEVPESISPERCYMWYAGAGSDSFDSLASHMLVNADTMYVVSFHSRYRGTGRRYVPSHAQVILCDQR